MYIDNTIIKDLRVLTEEFIPSRLLHRDSQISTIRDNLAPLVDKQKARNMFLYGPPGIGKTSLSKFIVEELKSHVAILSSYVNCWNAASEFKVLYNILHDFGQSFVHRKGIPTDELIDQVKKKLDRPCVIILDEVDQLKSDKILYELLGLNIGLILIANKETALSGLEDRVRSRFAAADHIEFQAYRNGEIFDILKDRRDWGLVKGSASSGLLESIASISGGDCRFAIDVLRIVAEEAEKKDLEKIPEDFVDKFVPKAKSESASTVIGRLNDHQKIMYEIVKQKQSIDPQEFYKEFNKKCKEAGLELIVDRTARKYLEKLASYNLIKFKGEGKGRSYSI